MAGLLRRRRFLDDFRRQRRRLRDVERRIAHQPAGGERIGEQLVHPPHARAIMAWSALALAGAVRW